MDCEKFDKVVLDLLYEELDELTHAAAKRHMDQCSRCRGIATGLRATRDVGVLPMVEPPEGLTRRILSAERNARAQLPLGQRVGRAVSVLAGYAMRPQLAMAATLLLMIGGSLLFLRSRPGDRDNVHVTERGVPEAEAESVAIVPLAAEPLAEEERMEAPDRTARRGRARRPAPAPGAAPADQQKALADNTQGLKAAKTADAFDEFDDDAKRADKSDQEDGEYQAALGSYRDGRYDEALRRFDKIARAGGPKAPSASLLAAQSARISSGCKAAAPRFERVNSSYRGTGVAHEATWQAADCYRVMGQTDRARRSYESLVSVAGYGERAKRALASLGARSPEPGAVASRKRAAGETPKPPAKAKVKGKDEAPPQAAPPANPPKAAKPAPDPKSL